MQTFLARYNYYCHYLADVENSYLSIFRWNGDTYTLDYTRAMNGPSFVGSSEVVRYARNKIKSYMLITGDCPDTIRRHYGSLPALYSMFKDEARLLGFSSFPRIPILASCLAGYFNLSLSERRSLSRVSNVFKEIEETNRTPLEIFMFGGGGHPSGEAPLSFDSLYPPGNEKAAD